MSRRGEYPRVELGGGYVQRVGVSIPEVVGLPPTTLVFTGVCLSMQGGYPRRRRGVSIPGGVSVEGGVGISRWG